MEDAHLAVPALNIDESAAVFGVFDGHGGAFVFGGVGGEGGAAGLQQNE